jgi:TetR/AcrR family transcriptional regulator, regulator of cefoperazone and chloramphenicol sensitivity
MPRRPRDDARDTRTAIIEAAMRGFGERGFAATGIREIATLAGTNVASISYHFGGKEGLRAACAEHIVKVLGEVLAAARADNSPPEDPEAAERALAALVHAFVRFLLLEPQARLVAGFILREMAEPSAALDIIYEGLFEGLHRRLCAIWGVATGAAPESEPVRLAVFAAIGQIVYFHLGRPVVQRRMDWPTIGPPEAQAIAETVIRNLGARLAADRRAAP